MNDQTFSHMLAWVERQFGEDQTELVSTMLAQYRTDPEHYDRAGWWRCHDDMIAAGFSTL